MLHSLYKALKKSQEILCQDTSMCLDLICEDLFYNYGINATYLGRSIYVDDVRVASIKTCKEGYELVSVFDFTILI